MSIAGEGRQEARVVGSAPGRSHALLNVTHLPSGNEGTAMPGRADMVAIAAELRAFWGGNDCFGGLRLGEGLISVAVHAREHCDWLWYDIPEPTVRRSRRTWCSRVKSTCTYSIAHTVLPSMRELESRRYVMWLNGVTGDLASRYSTTTTTHTMTLQNETLRDFSVIPLTLNLESHMAQSQQV